MRRRDFVVGLGGTVATLAAAQAQQSTTPVIGLLHPSFPDTLADYVRGFHRGLKETGFVEGENVAIEYRWAEGKYDQLPELAADLVRRRVTVIAALGGPASVLATKAVTATIPILFIVAEDPVRLGLVASLARPGANLTGVNFFGGELTAKRLELLRELVPAASRVALLVNPSGPVTEVTLRDVEPAARAMGLQIQVYRASNSTEISAAFTRLMWEQPDALFVGSDPTFTGRRVQVVQLAAHHRIPTTYSSRQFPDIGGLMSYGTSIVDAWRQVGSYVGRILKGAKPADLPVVQSTKFELVINHQTARTLGLTVPPSLLGVADEVIE